MPSSRGKPKRPSLTSTGLNRKTKSYQSYMKERRRVQRIASRRRTMYGEDIDIDAILAEKTNGHQPPSTYGELRRATNILKKVHSGDTLSSMMGDVLGKEYAGEQRTVREVATEPQPGTEAVQTPVGGASPSGSPPTPVSDVEKTIQDFVEEVVSREQEAEGEPLNTAAVDEWLAREDELEDNAHNYQLDEEEESYSEWLNGDFADEYEEEPPQQQYSTQEYEGPTLKYADVVLDSLRGLADDMYNVSFTELEEATQHHFGYKTTYDAIQDWMKQVELEYGGSNLAAAFADMIANGREFSYRAAKYAEVFDISALEDLLEETANKANMDVSDDLMTMLYDINQIQDEALANVLGDFMDY